MILESARVSQITQDCLVGDIDEEHLAIEGVVNNYAFNREKLAEYESEIIDMLKELPDEFHKEKGGGWSFLNACLDRHGNQWTGMHLVQENLLALGMAIGKVTCPIPREMWGALPGNVPYYVIEI